MAIATQYQTKKIYLPSTIDKPEEERLWVMVKDKLFVGDMIPVFDNSSESAKRVAGTAAVIVDWNLTEEDGTPIEVNFDTVKTRMLFNDFKYVVDIYDKLFDEATSTLDPEQKKTSGSTLTPSETTPQVNSVSPSQ